VSRTSFSFLLFFFSLSPPFFFWVLLSLCRLLLFSGFSFPGFLPFWCRWPFIVHPCHGFSRQHERRQLLQLPALFDKLGYAHAVRNDGAAGESAARREAECAAPRSVKAPTSHGAHRAGRQEPERRRQAHRSAGDRAFFFFFCFFFFFIFFSFFFFFFFFFCY